MRQFNQKGMIDFFSYFDLVLEWEEFFLLNLNLIFGFLFGGIRMEIFTVEGFLDELDGVKLAIGVASGEVDFAEPTDS